MVLRSFLTLSKSYHPPKSGVKVRCYSQNNTTLEISGFNLIVLSIKSIY